jgi:hypothetical protein
MKPFLLLLLPAALFLAALPSVRGQSSGDATAEARKVLEAFLQPGADLKALSLQLRPTAAEVAQVYEESFAQKLHALYDPAWSAGALVLAPKEGQTALLLDDVSSDSIRAWDAKAQEILPGGYEQVKGDIKPGLTIYRFKFVKPGETTGMAFDGLVRVGDRWIILPKPWRAKG